MPLSGILVLVLLSNFPAAQIQQARAAPRVFAQVETYESAAIDANGRLRISTSDHRTILVAKQRQQSSFSKPILSAGRTAVGAQANYPNCCTSYDIPLQLVIYSRGKRHWFKGSGLPIFRWHFADDAGSVAYGQETVHSSCGVHYELRDIESERLIDSADVPQPCAERRDPPEVPIPKWVKALNAARR